MSEPQGKLSVPGLGQILATIVLILAIVFYVLGKLPAPLALLLGALALARLT